MACILLAEMEREWAALAHGPESTGAFRAAAAAAPALGALGAEDLGDVVARVRPGPDQLPPAEAGRVVAALLKAAPAHQLLVRAVVQCVVRGLPRQLARLGSLIRVWGTLDDALPEAVGLLTIVVMEWQGADRPYAALDILSAVRCRMRRQAIAELRRQGHEVSGTVEDTPGRGQSALDELAGLLAQPDLVGLAPDGAALLALTVVHGYRVSEVAAMTGRSARELGQRKESAQRCLVA